MKAGRRSGCGTHGGQERAPQRRGKAAGLSPWQDSVRLPEYPALTGDEKTDVLIVGGGLAGILCAWNLSQQGVDCIVAEQYRVGQGITAKTTGKITSQHGLIYDKLCRTAGAETAARYLHVNEQAIARYADLAGRINCDFERKNNLVYSMRGEQLLEREMAALEKIGYKALYREGRNISLPLLCDGAVEFPMQAQFNPLKLMDGLLRTACGSVRIYENTQITNIEIGSAKERRGSSPGTKTFMTAWHAGGKISADTMIVTSHFPFLGRHGAYFLKMYQSRSSVIAGTFSGGSGGLGNLSSLSSSGGKVGECSEGDVSSVLDGMYVDESENGLSFRSSGNLLLVGGGASRAGVWREGWDDLESLCQSSYPGWQTRYRWANQDCITLDGLPYIGLYYRKQDLLTMSAARDCKQHSGLYLATGFNKWGMSGSMVAAMILADMVLGRKSEYAELFDPSRSMMKKQIFVNGMEAVKNLLTPAVPRCRHLGCALKWNEQEKSWDCPCHGSRYDKDGRCIENPSKKGFD